MKHDFVNYVLVNLHVVYCREMHHMHACIPKYLAADW